MTRAYLPLLAGACLALAFVWLFRRDMPPVPFYSALHTPILVPSLDWEHNAVYEPNILKVNGRYVMWYGGGWERAAIGVAWSENGIHWAKHGPPVIGLGAAGIQGSAAHFSVMQYGDKFYCFFADTTLTSPLYAAQSIDGVTWTNVQRVLDPGREDTSIANTHVWVEDGTWHMLYESKWGNSGIWKLGTAHGRDAYHWTKDTFPILMLGYGDATGGPFVERVYLMTYHAAPLHGSDLPTRIYQAISSDLVHWREIGLALDMTEEWTRDQVADPYLLNDWMFFSGMDNQNEAGSIGLAIKGD